MKFSIIYFSPYDLLRPRTNQVSDVRFCEAVADNDIDVVLVVPQVEREDNLQKKEILKNYDLEKEFPIEYLNTSFQNENLNKKEYLKLSFLCLKRLLKLNKKSKTEIFYVISRSEILLVLTLLYKKVFLKKKWKIVPWLHELKTRKIHRWVYRNANLILATNSSIISDLHTVLEIKNIPCELTLNPISERQKDIKISKISAREKIKYTSTKPLIVYTGKLFINQIEINYIIEAARLLPQFQFIFTGGKPEVLLFYQEKFRLEAIDNIQLTGYISDYSQIKYYQKSADLLLSYYTSKEHEIRYNLPNKICEYMLTGNPILSPFFPATNDLLSEDNAFNVAPDDCKALKDRIQFIFENPEEMSRRAKNAYNLVVNMTYKKVVAKILISIENAP